MAERLELTDTSAGMFAAMVRGERTWGLFTGRFDENRWWYSFTDKGAGIASDVGIDPRTDSGLYLFTLLLAMADPELREHEICHPAVVEGEWADRRIEVPLQDAIAIVRKALSE